MITQSVTIEDIDHLFLQWHDHISASALYRQALREEMVLRDVDPRDLRTALDRARDDMDTRLKSSPPPRIASPTCRLVDDQPRRRDPATEEPDGR